MTNEFLSPMRIYTHKKDRAILVTFYPRFIMKDKPTPYFYTFFPVLITFRRAVSRTLGGFSSLGTVKNACMALEAVLISVFARQMKDLEVLRRKFCEE